MQNEIARRYSDIEDLQLRTFNRAVTVLNLEQDFGADAVRDYLDGFSEVEKKQLYIMFGYIKANGIDAVRKTVTQSIKLAEPSYEYKEPSFV